MDGRWEQVKQIVYDAMKLPLNERARFVEESCGDDVALRGEVEGLLVEHDRTGEFLVPLSLPHDRLEQYELREEIGFGGSGVVYRAFDTKEEREVAIKILRPSHGLTKRHIQDFLDEAARLRSFDHPGIVRVLETGIHNDIPFFVMEYAAGGSLSDLIREAKANGEEVALPGKEGEGYSARVARILAQVADALQYAHDRDIAHRDIKPSNIVFDADDHALVVDFGIARDLTREQMTWVPRGTPHYMSPEQALLRGMKIDHRTDIYSLGVVGYELLTRRVPFEGDTDEEIFSAIRSAEPDSITGQNHRVPKDLETICLKAMRKDRRRRYATAADFADDLRRFLRHESPLARPPGWIERMTPWARKHRLALCTGAAVLLTLVIGGGVERGMEWSQANDAIAAIAAIERGPAPTEDADPTPAHLVRRVEALGELSAQAAAVRARFRLSESQRAVLLELEAACAEGATQLYSQALRDAPSSLSTLSMLDGDTDAAQLLYVIATAPKFAREEASPTHDDFKAALGARITVTSEPPGASVRVIRIDPRTFLPVGSPPIEVGRTPLEGDYVPIGHYRIEFAGDDGREGELVRSFELATSYDLPTVWLRDSNDVVAGMVRIDAGRFAIGRDTRERLHVPPPPNDVDVAGFYVDPHEVTNREYRRFVAETAHRRPDIWPPDSEWQEEWDRLPVASVDFYDAEAYAAWAGKRLLHEVEWERAARGNDARLTPWGPPYDRDATGLANSRAADRASYRQDPTLSRDERNRAAWEIYLRHIREVGSLPNDRSPDGLFDVSGNLSELTVTIPILGRTPKGDLVLQLQSRAIVGGSFQMRPNVLTDGYTVPVVNRDISIGFRCGRSIRP